MCTGAFVAAGVLPLRDAGCARGRVCVRRVTLLPRRATPRHAVPVASAANAALAAGTVLFSVCNRVAYKLQVAGVMGRYSILIALFTTACYILVYFPMLALRTARGIVLPADVRAALRKYWPALATIGACEALTFCLQLRAAVAIPGSLIGILGQALLPFSMVASSMLYGRSYTASQIIGVIAVIGGVVLSIFPTLSVSGGRSVMLSSCGFVASFMFLAVSIAIKEVVLKGGNVLGRGALAGAETGSRLRPDLFVVNSFGSLFQLVVTAALLPVVLALAAPQITIAGGAWTYVKEGLRGLFFSPYMPWLTIAYIFANISFNLCGLTLMSRASSTLVLLSSVAAVPLVSLVFCLPLPLVTPSPFSWFTLAGLAVVMLGVVLYNRPTKKAVAES